MCLLVLSVPWFVPLVMGTKRKRKDKERWQGKAERGGKRKIKSEKTAVPGAPRWAKQSIQYSMLTWA